MGQRRTVQDVLIAHPVADWTIPIVTLLAWSVLGFWFPDSTTVRVSLYTTLSASSGIALAIGAFICAHLLQSPNSRIQYVRERFKDQIRRNWLSILIWLLVSTMLPVATIIFDGILPTATFGAGLLAGAILLVKLLRLILWIDIVFLLEHGTTDPTVEEEVKWTFSRSEEN